MRLSELFESLGQVTPSLIGVPPQWAPAPGKYQKGARVTKGGSVWECRATNNAGYSGCNDAAYGPVFNSPEWAYIATFPVNGLAVPETNWKPGTSNPYGPTTRVMHQSNVFECVDAAKCRAGEMPGYSSGWKQLTAGSMYIITPNPVPVAAAPVATPVPVPVVVAPTPAIPVTPRPVPVTVAAVIAAKAAPVEAPTPAALTPAPAVAPEVIRAPMASTATLSPAAAAASTATSPVAPVALTVQTTVVPEPSKPFYQRPEVFAGALAVIGAGWWYYSKRR